MTSLAPDPARVPVRRTVRRWLPQQHGAWAMLSVPFLAGAFLGGWTGWHALLFPAWLLAYGTAYHAQGYLRLRRIARNPRSAKRHVAPASGFGLAFLVLAVPLAVARPWLVLAALAMLPFFAVNLGYAYRNDERAIANDLAALVPACGMLLVSYRLGGEDLGPSAWRAALACLLYFTGSVLYVKTMIRERRNRSYRVASAGYHGVALLLAALLDLWLALPFAGYLARAVVLPGRNLRIHVIGAIEVLNSALLLLVLVLLG